MKFLNEADRQAAARYDRSQTTAKLNAAVREIKVLEQFQHLIRQCDGGAGACMALRSGNRGLRALNNLLRDQSEMRSGGNRYGFP
jgi:hypothetical protein